MDNFGLLFTALLCSAFALSFACNDSVCGSIVTKCQLLKRCNCEMPNYLNAESCECCADCAVCLEDKYPSCCSCVGMCEPPEMYDPSLANASSVADLKEPIPGLFAALTTLDESEVWSVHRYPAYETLMNHRGIGVSIDREQSLVNFVWDNEVLSTVRMENCSVAYVKDCMPLKTCKDTCNSMGAAKFRWFHDQGCCECVGDKCIDYGKNVPLCERCTNPPEELDSPLIFDEL